MSEEIPNVPGAPVVPVAPLSPAEASPATPTRRHRTWLIILTVLVGLNMLLTCGLGCGIAWFFFGPGYYFDSFMYDDETYMRADSLGYDIGYMILANDVDAYMGLYDPNDPTVDYDVVREQFETVVSKVGTDTAGEFMAETLTLYTDEETDEEIVKMTIGGYDYMSGRPIAGRLTVYAVIGDDGDRLTGVEGRDLAYKEALW